MFRELRGKPVADAICAGLDVSNAPVLVIEHGGDDGDDLAYLRGIAKKAESLGITVEVRRVEKRGLKFTANGVDVEHAATARAVVEILDFYGYEPRGRDIVIIGRSKIVGRPLFDLLLARDATVTVCHTKTRDLKSHTRRADIVVCAAGVAGLCDDGFFREGQVVIDVGTNVVDGKLVGDAAYTENFPGEAITPVPGGVGAVTTAVLLRNVINQGESIGL